MKKLNFKELALKSLDGTIEMKDMQKTIAEQIYANTGGLAFKLLAEKIYKADGEFELDKNELKSLMPVILGDSALFTNIVCDAIMEQLEKEDQPIK